MTLPHPRFTPFRFFALAALLLGACSDGPNETGLSYIQHQGIQLSTPLYHFTFQNFPVDSVFSAAFPLNHFGESLQVVGRSNGFQASVRMGFQITTQEQRDSIVRGLTLRVVSLPPLAGGDSLVGFGFLDTSTFYHDSLTLLIKSFAWNDTADQFGDSLPVFHTRILASFNTPFSALDTRYVVLDTARIGMRDAYHAGTSRDSIQFCVLKNLQARMYNQGRLSGQKLKDTTDNWIVYLEISPMSNAPDSGMFRFIANGGTPYNPGLLLGKYGKRTPDTLPTLLIPYTSGGLAGVNYQVQHSGNTGTLLYGVSRGLNFRLNRNRLLDSIQARMGANYPAASNKKYDARFYVPYADLHLPLTDGAGNLDPRTHVDGPFALDMQLASEVDSVDPQSGKPDTIPVFLGGSLRLFPLQAGAPGYAGQPIDTLICTYRKLPGDTADSSVRQMILGWVKDAATIDTFLLTPDGNRRELTLKRHNGWLQPATLGVYPEESQALVEVYFNVGSGTEASGFVIPGTTTQQTAYSTLKQRYWRPGASELVVRATNSMATLLNRADSSVGSPIPQMLLKPTDRNAFDTSYVDTSSYELISYPVFGEIGFPLQKGITVDVYLYPLGIP